VQVDVAAHGVDLAEAVTPPFLAAQPQDARQDPVPSRMLGGEGRRPPLAGQPTAAEHGTRGRPAADLRPDAVAAARGAAAALALAGAVACGRHPVAAD